MWWEGWGATLPSLAQAVWKKDFTTVLNVAAAALSALSVVASFAFVVLRGRVPAWMGLAAAAVAAVPLLHALVPRAVREGLVRRRMEAYLRQHYADMWAIHQSWVLHEGREFWVAEEGGEVVAGTALQLGAAARRGTPSPAAASTAATSSTATARAQARPPHAAAASFASPGLAAAALDEEGAPTATTAAQPSAPVSDSVDSAAPGAATAAAAIPDSGSGGGSASGFGSAERTLYGDALTANDALLFRFIVHDAWRKRGVGRRLLAHVVDGVASQRGAARVRLSTANPGAVAFFQRSGFAEDRKLGGLKLMVRELRGPAVEAGASAIASVSGERQQ